MSQWQPYIDAGWALCAIVPGTKGPKTTDWNTKGFPFNPGARGAGLCHAWSGTCSIDIDHFDHAAKYLKGHNIELKALLSDPDAVQISSGRPGRGKLLYTLPTPLPSLKRAPYQVPNADDPAKPKTFHGIEFRCATVAGLTVQDVLPPTIHPDTGMPYQWVYGSDFGHWSNPPPLPAALEALWRAEMAPAPEASIGPQDAKGAELDELRGLLAQQDPDADYESWLKVGMALHHETRGSQKGFGLWDRWSAQSKAKYKGHADLMSHWSSFNYDASNPITLGALRRETAAAPEDFPIEDSAEVAESGEFGNAPDNSEDTRPVAVMQRLLEPRLVYLLNQDRYYFIPNEKQPLTNLDEHGECGLSGRGVHMLFNSHMPTIVYQDAKGNTKSKKVTPAEYLESSRTKLIVGALGFHPGAGRIYTEERIKYLNRYVPHVVESLRPKAHEVEAWRFLTGRIKDDLFRKWLLKFYAFALRHPGIKIQSAPLLFSQIPGTGKSTLMKTVPELLYGSRYVKAVSSDVINSRFTGVLSDTWWVVLDELKTSGLKFDRVHIANKLKPWITERTIEIEKKGLDPYHVVNRVQLTGTSNHDDAVHIENDDRRWGISEMGGNTMTEREKTDLYGGFFNTNRAAGVVKFFIEQENLTGFSPTAQPPDTAGKTLMAVAGLGGWETKISEMMTRGDAPFDRDVVKAHDVQDVLQGAHPPSERQIGNFLKRAPFHGHKVHCVGGNYLIWRNVQEWKRCTGQSMMHHQETGNRPSGREWDLTVPIAIRQVTGDDGEPESFDELLGDYNG